MILIGHTAFVDNKFFFFVSRRKSKIRFVTMSVLPFTYITKTLTILLDGTYIFTNRIPLKELSVV